VCELKYLDGISYAAYVERVNVRQKLDKTNGSGRSYSYANVNSSYKKLKSGDDNVISERVQFQNRAYKDLQ
jgi:hypothetical protein